MLIVLYIGTQLGASAVTAISADPTQQRIMFALPFVFMIFIINFEAGLIVYWITTNVWTVGQQLLVKKLYPKPLAYGEKDDAEGGKPARGKPVRTASGGAAAAGNSERSGSQAKASRRWRKRPRAKAPPNPAQEEEAHGRRR